MPSYRFTITRGGIGGPAKGFPGGAAVTILGTKELDAKLRHLGGLGSRQVAAAGIAAALPWIAGGFRAVISTTGISPGSSRKPRNPEALKREARKTIGYRFNRGGTNRIGVSTQPIAKAGFSVGKRTQRAKRIQRAVSARQKRIAKGKQRDRGVGISAQNVHWTVLGTGERHHKRPPHKYTGKMPAFFLGAGQKAMAIAGPAATAAACIAMKRRLELEARKGFVG